MAFSDSSLGTPPSSIFLKGNERTKKTARAVQARENACLSRRFERFACSVSLRVFIIFLRIYMSRGSIFLPSRPIRMRLRGEDISALQNRNLRAGGKAEVFFIYIYV